METENIQSELAFFSKPSLTHRFKSMMIDVVVIIFLIFLMSLLLEILSIESGLVRKVCFGLIILYEPILVSIGGTIGQVVMGLRVLNFTKYSEHQSKQRLNIFYSLIRYILKLFLGWISFVTIHSSNYGQAIHDKAGNSLMTFK